MSRIIQPPVGSAMSVTAPEVAEAIRQYCENDARITVDFGTEFNNRLYEDGPMYCSHYSYSQDPGNLRRFGETVAAGIHHAFPNMDKIRPVLLYMGMSGTALATSVLMADDWKKPPASIYVRKRGEKSHGSPIEYSYDERYTGRYALVFIDDCVDSGETLRTCFTKMQECDAYFEELEIEMWSSLRSRIARDHYYVCLQRMFGDVNRTDANTRVLGGVEMRMPGMTF